MTADIDREIHAGLDNVTPARRAMIHQAFQLLPRLERPRILDIGCGRGGPTLELARLSGGLVIGVDIDAEALGELAARIAAEGLAERVRVRRCSMTAMDFEDGSFDILWAEGSILAMGFEEALAAWRRLLPEGGFLVVHESAWLRPHPPQPITAHWTRLFPGMRTVAEYEAACALLGYRSIGSFLLPVDFWWENYYGLMQTRIQALRDRYAEDRAALAILDRQEREVELYRGHRTCFGSAYLAMSKA